MQSKEVILIWEDEQGKQRNAFVKLLEMNESFLTFQTQHNTITIPTSKLIKMKEKKENV